MSDITPRLALPMIVPGQAQKDMAHNEALALLDIAVQASVVAAGVDRPPADPQPGQCWIVGGAPVAAWVGRTDHVAGWTAGGWRFVPPVEGFLVRIAGDAGFARFAGGQWRIAVSPPVPADPVGGDVIDLQARSAIRLILDALQAAGLAAKGV